MPSAATAIYTLSLHDALPILRHDHVVLQWEGPIEFARGRLEVERALPLLPGALPASSGVVGFIQKRRTAEVLQDRKSTRLNSSHSQISYAVFCLKKKKRELRG